MSKDPTEMHREANHSPSNKTTDEPSGSKRFRIPEQFTGKQLNYSRTVNLRTTEEAIRHFNSVRDRLLDVNDWHRYAAAPSARFQIVDATNQVQARPVREGDTIRIDIPGPGLPSADGFDWVRVEKIEAQEAGPQREIGLTLRPCSDPTSATFEDPPNPNRRNDSDLDSSAGDTAHFFKHLATSTFLVRQQGNEVQIRYAGRNEVINTENISAWDNFRNFLIGLGAKLGASYPQWKGLVDGLGDIRNERDPA